MRTTRFHEARAQEQLRQRRCVCRGPCLILQRTLENAAHIARHRLWRLVARRHINSPASGLAGSMRVSNRWQVESAAAAAAAASAAAAAAASIAAVAAAAAVAGACTPLTYESGAANTPLSGTLEALDRSTSSTSPCGWQGGASRQLRERRMASGGLLARRGSSYAGRCPAQLALQAVQAAGMTQGACACHTQPSPAQPSPAQPSPAHLALTAPSCWVHTTLPGLRSRCTNLRECSTATWAHMPRNTATMRRPPVAGLPSSWLVYASVIKLQAGAEGAACTTRAQGISQPLMQARPRHGSIAAHSHRTPAWPASCRHTPAHRCVTMRRSPPCAYAAQIAQPAGSRIHKVTAGCTVGTATYMAAAAAISSKPHSLMQLTVPFTTPAMGGWDGSRADPVGSSTASSGAR